MAKNDFRLDGDTQDRFQESILSFFEKFSDPANKKARQALYTVLIAVLLGVGAFGYYNVQQKGLESGWREELGQAMAFSAQGKSQEAKEAYRSFLANPAVNGLFKAKASLLLGDIYYYEGNYPAAKEQYEAAAASGSSSTLIASGAEHGLAAILVQTKAYEEAAQKLEAFVNKWSVRKAAVGEGFGGDDQIVQVPEALVQLSLCYKELGKAENAKAAAQKVIQVYPDSRQASMARKVISTL